MDTRTFIVTNQDETTEQMVSIDWHNGQSALMTLTDFKAQYPDEPEPTIQ